MDEKGIRAGLDVFRGEPSGDEVEFQSALARHPNVYGTHHIGASTDQAQAAVASGVIEILDAFSRGNIQHCVNMDT
jgi:D-3-phosphoglycerate dehydrogenase